MKDIYTFKFWKHKYGPELLVDIVDYAVMLPPIRKHPTFTETVSPRYNLHRCSECTMAFSCAGCGNCGRCKDVELVDLNNIWVPE